ncbi:MAG: hypothetical protein E6G00_05370 [Actinobacteria bacterium]|nr:MAG: hypothetical protein E6G00_05370 [Actinomycetota bacterium]
MATGAAPASPRGRRLVGRVALLGAVVFLAVPASALASQRFASPNGAGTACSSAHPCRITTAINNAGAGDEVILAPGNYGSPASRIATSLSNGSANLNIHGVAGRPRPQIFSSGDFPLSVYGSGDIVRHIAIDGSGSANSGSLNVIGNGDLAEDFVAYASAQRGCQANHTATLRDGVCRSSSGAGVLCSTVLAPTPGVTLRNMTILSSNGRAIDVESATSRPVTVTAINTIARGGGGASDLYVLSGENANATLNVSHDNFATESTEVQASTSGQATIADDGTSQSASPLLASPAAGDVHELFGSPTINAGRTSPANGAFDVYGNPRTVGTATDIGAAEFNPSNAFSFGKVTLHRHKRTATLAVKVPGRGTLVAFAKGIKRTQKTVAARGSVKLPVIPKGKLAKRLKKNGKASVTVKVTYTPTDGNPRTEHKKITLEAAKSKRH